MDSEAILPSKDLIKCCYCGCSCSLTNGYPGNWIRSVKRKHHEFEIAERYRCFIPGFDNLSVARVQIENECAALREMVSNQQKTVDDLYIELEKERNASSTAANEAMSMILRLQREKAEIQMEARQFKRFVEEKMAHDLEEIYAVEDVLYKREQAIQSLTCEVQAYKHRLLSYGLTEAEVDGEKGISRNTSFSEDLDERVESPAYDYPPLKCKVNETQGPLEGDNKDEDIEKYAFGETPRDQLKNLELRIHEMERYPSNNQLDVDSPSGKSILEKVVVGQSPKWPRHSRMFSTDSSNSFIGTGLVPDPAMDSPRLNGNIEKIDYVSSMDYFSNSKKLDDVSDIDDDTSDRVYTIDSIHNGVPSNGVMDSKAGDGFKDYATAPKEPQCQLDMDEPDDIKKLYMRLQVLEADRESMRQAIISMRTDNAQLVLLKEIAQRLCKEMPAESRMPLTKTSGARSFLSVVKWTVSCMFWRRRARQSRFVTQSSLSDTGLLMLLDRSPSLKQGRCVYKAQV